MKAMLSSQIRHTKELVLFKSDETYLAWDAIKEAEHILSQTEPTFDPMIGHHSQASWQMLGASALAESLSTFLNEEF